MNRKWYRGALLALVILLGGGVSLAQPTVAHMQATTPTADVLPAPPTMPSGPTAASGPSATPLVVTATSQLDITATTLVPDRCEPNDTRDQPCPLAVDAVNGSYTFLPQGDQDYYRLDLGAPNGLGTTITVRDAGSLDLLTSISREDGTTLATIVSPAISTTLAPDVAGVVLVRVENRSPSDPAHSSYNIEVRRTLPPAPNPPGNTVQPSLPPDMLENNWSPDTAAPIAVGVVYELNFRCPEAWEGACAGGDHDYLAVPVKANTNYFIGTFDLGPGVDTVIDLFWGEREAPLISNDDYYHAGMLSVIRWHAPANGTAIVRVGPRNGGTTPIVDDGQAGFYRFAVALDGSDLARQLNERSRVQSGVPTPTAASAAPVSGAGAAGAQPASGNVSPPPAAPPVAPSAAADAPQGVVVVMAESTVLREGPDAKAAAIQTLPQESLVTLTGQVSGSWVRGLPADGVVPGWVYGPDLRPLTTTTPTPGSADAVFTPGAGGTPIIPSMTMAPATPTPVPQVVVTRLDPMPQPLPVAPPPRQTLTLSVTVVVATAPPLPTPGPGLPRPTAAPAPPLSGVRVQLVNVFGDVLAEAVTPPSGTVRLTREVAPDAAVFVRVPSVGLQVRLNLSQPVLTLAIPTGERP